MVSADQILAVTDQIARQFKPQRIIVFGSYAYGKPTDRSDVDVLVVMRYRGDHQRKASEIANAVPTRFWLQIHLRSDAEIKRRIGWGDFFLDEITRKGLTVYEPGNPRVAEQGRKRLRRRRAVASGEEATVV